MTNRFMISVAAAALIAGTGFANAQGTGTSREAPSAGSTVQQSAPSSERGAPSAAPMNRDAGESKGMKSTQSDEKLQPKGKSLSAQDDLKAGAKGEKSAQDNNMKGEKSKSMSSETTTDKSAASKDMKAEGRDSKGNVNAQSREGQSGNMNAQAPAAPNAKSQTTSQAPAAPDSKSQTTGNAATSATAAPPPEKRTQIVSAIRTENIPEATNVNVNLSIGVALPSTVHFYPLPPRIVEIYPEWRGYEVVRIHGKWVIVRPQTRTVVYIIEG